MGNRPPHPTPPLGIGNREWGIGEEDLPTPPPTAFFSPPPPPAISFPIPTIPHSRLPIPKGGVMWGGEPPYSSGILPAFPASH